MSTKRKHKPERYTARILAVLETKPAGMLRSEIAARLNVGVGNLSTAMQELVSSGAIVATKARGANGHTYALPRAKPAPIGIRQWTAPAPHQFAPAPVVSLPLEPWADTVLAEAPQIASGRPYRPASVAGGSVNPGAAKAASGQNQEGLS